MNKKTKKTRSPDHYQRAKVFEAKNSAFPLQIDDCLFSGRFAIKALEGLL